MYILLVVWREDEQTGRQTWSEGRPKVIPTIKEGMKCRLKCESLKEKAGGKFPAKQVKLKWLIT